MFKYSHMPRNNVLVNNRLNIYDGGPVRLYGAVKFLSLSEVVAVLTTVVQHITHVYDDAGVNKPIVLTAVWHIQLCAVRNTL